MKSQYFNFTEGFTEINKTSTLVEKYALSDPRTSCFYARRTVELLVDWIYEHDNTLRRPYESSLSNLIHAFNFRDLVGEQLLGKFKLLKDLGNKAVHRNDPISQGNAVLAASELFQILRWFALTYGRNPQVVKGLKFDKKLLPKGNEVSEQTKNEISALAEQLSQKDKHLREEHAKNTAYQDELERVKKELAKIKKANKAKQKPEEEITEFETRKRYIDVYLEEAGWKLGQGRSDEVDVVGMPNESGEGSVDYVLWGDDGKPLALVEAKRTSKDPIIGQQQAKLYADCLETKFGQRPIIFLSNGYRHLIWDDNNYPRRDIQGFYKKEELELLIRRRESLKPLKDIKINKNITERDYQHRAIRRISESFEKIGRAHV